MTPIARSRRAERSAAAACGASANRNYGGEVTFALVARHLSSGETTLRFAEPVDTDLNPVWNEIHGLPPDRHAGFLHDLRERLYDPAVCLAHTWRPGDVVMTDNHALLHGRRASTDPGAGTCGGSTFCDRGEPPLF